MASNFCRGFGLTKQVRLERIVRRRARLPGNLLIYAAEGRWKAFVMRKIVHYRKNRVLALNMKLWVELSRRQEEAIYAT